MNAEQSAEADREFVQYFQRRIAWLALREFDRAIADADHTLSFMDFVRNSAPTNNTGLRTEQFRGFVLFHRAQAMAARAIERNDPESAVDAVQSALAKIQALLTEHELEEQVDEDVLVMELQKLEQSLRNMHGIEETLNEQLARAVANEEYETAAQLQTKSASGGSAQTPTTKTRRHEGITKISLRLAASRLREVLRDFVSSWLSCRTFAL